MCFVEQQYSLTMSSNNAPLPPNEDNSFEELSDDSNGTNNKINQLFSNVAKKNSENAEFSSDDSSESTRGTFAFLFIVRLYV